MKALPTKWHPVRFRVDRAVQFFVMLATPASEMAAHPERLRECAFIPWSEYKAASLTRSQPATSSSFKFFNPCASAANPLASTYDFADIIPQGLLDACKTGGSYVSRLYVRIKC